jgi:hypothetical protein
MDQQAQAPKTTIALGVLTAAMGVFVILLALGVIPSNAGSWHAPGWVGALAGLAFLFGGAAVVMQTAITGDRGPDGDLPATAPRWLRAIYYLMVLAIVGALAAVGSWVAFGPGERAFTATIPFLGERVAGQTQGRIAFGLGAVLAWIMLVVMARGACQRLFGTGNNCWPAAAAEPRRSAGRAPMTNSSSATK